MRLRPPGSTRTDPLCPYTTLFRSTIAVTVPEQALAGLRNNPNIVLIERDQPKYPSGQVTPYGISSVQAPDTVATGADGSGIKVCVIRSEEHTSELQSLMRISYAVFCLKKKQKKH